jgi:hypothetical protein
MEVARAVPTRHERGGGEMDWRGLGAVRSRLASHLIPFDELAMAGPYSPESSRQIGEDYEQFLQARASMMMPVIQSLCLGDHP